MDWQEYLKWRDGFHASLDPELYPCAWLDGEVACGRMRLFAGDSSAILCSIRRYPTGLEEVHAELAIGNLGEIEAYLIPKIEAWAVTRGCKAASVQSRAGWVKIMQRHGYSLFQTTMRKAL